MSLPAFFRTPWPAWSQALRRDLGLEPDAAPGLWLLRLVFRPPRSGRPDYALLLARQIGRRLGHALGVTGKPGVRVWLWRLVFRQRQPRRRLATDLRKLRQRQEERSQALRDWLNRKLAPIHRRTETARQTVARRLPDVDWDGINTRLEGWAERFSRVPYIRRVLWLAALAAGIGICTTPLELEEQFLLFAVVWITVLVLRRVPGRLVSLIIISLALLMTGRYVWWRTTQTLAMVNPLDAVVGYILFCAEVYTWIVLALGYIQTAWPLNRKPRPLPSDPAQWPTVDVFIPTYNEPLAVVRPTVFAATSMDWPSDKLRVYILDDGTREEFRAFAEEAGVGYIVRAEHGHAKAGNINNALSHTGGEYIAIFDCDHIPVRSFLQTTMGQFIADPKCAMVQTPHHFFSPDPFERNLDTFHRVPNEGSLFYGLIQDGNDFWNATFFCGSCAVLKRAPLLEVGGIAVETVTEDAHTSLRLHRRGYNTAYFRTVQAAGLATESLAGHIGQRIRWARGMAQIFRVDNPLLGKGLSLFQRLCYSNAMLHFFYGIPRLIFLFMPCAYLYFGLHVIDTYALVILGYALPYLIISNLANSRQQGRYRHSFWAEVYESVLAWYIVLPTTIAFINPKLGKFNVTAKGGRIEHDYLDWTISKPYLVLLALNLIGMLLGLYRLLFGVGDEPATILMNMFWAGINMAVLGVAVGVAKEAKQVRVSHRIPLRVAAMLTLPDGRTIACRTDDYSVDGLGLRLPAAVGLQMGEQVGVSLSRGQVEHCFPATVARIGDRRLGIRLEGLSAELERELIQYTFGRADAWLEWEDVPQKDAPLNGLVEVIVMASEGYLRLYDAYMDAIDSFFSRRAPGARQT